MSPEKPANPNKVKYTRGAIVEFTQKAKEKFKKDKLGIQSGKLVDFDMDGTAEVIETQVHSGTGPNTVILKDKNGIMSGPLAVTHIRKATN